MENHQRMQTLTWGSKARAYNILSVPSFTNEPAEIGACPMI